MVSSPSRSYLLQIHDFLFLGRTLFVDFGHVPVRQLLDVVGGLLEFVLGDGLVLFQLLELVVGVAADVADGDLGFLAGLAGELAEFTGVRPRSDLRMAFSTLANAPRSQGWMVMVRLSGMATDASWLMGVGVP